MFCTLVIILTKGLDNRSKQSQPAYKMKRCKWNNSAYPLIKHSRLLGYFIRKDPLLDTSKPLHTKTLLHWNVIQAYNFTYRKMQYLHLALQTLCVYEKSIFFRVGSLNN